MEKKFKTKLMLLMEQRCVNMTALAKEIGVTPSAIFYWREGRNRISGESLIRLADFFGVHPREILGNVERPRKEKAVA